MKYTQVSQLLLVLVSTALAAPTTTSSSSIPASSLCPAANGTAVSNSGSSAYTVTCSSDSTQGSYKGVGAANSYLDCMTACDADSANGCLGFVYVGGQGGSGSGNCWLKTGMGSYTAAAGNYIAGLKGSALSQVVCPDNNNTIYTAANGNTYTIQCGIDRYAGDMSNVQVSSFAGCMEACSTTAGCIDVALSGSTCYMKSAVNAAVYNNVWGAILKSNKQLPAGVTSVGCNVDSVSARTLPYMAYGNSSNTPQTCALACRAAGYKYAGTEYSAECWCGNTLPAAANPSDCNMACSGDSNQYCGGPNRLSVTVDNTWSSSGAGSSSSGSSSTGSSGTGSSGTGSSSSSTASAASTSAASTSTTSSASSSSTSATTVSAKASYGSWTLLSCYSDIVSNRTLPNQVGVPGGTSNMTVENCLNACAASGQTYCGPEWAQECWASKTAPDTTRSLSGSPMAQGCNYTCTGNSAEACGGSNRVLVYFNTAASN